MPLIHSFSMSWSGLSWNGGGQSVERESLLVTLILLLGGLAIQLFAAWPNHRIGLSPSRQLERRLWLALWFPIAPALIVAAWLCGWALSQPDPVPGHVGRLIFIACAPFMIVAVRALSRAVWSLWRSPGRYAIATVGLLKPRIVIAPGLTALLDERALQAALAHEHAHLQHRDPLRIWLAQFVTDLQWPWQSARRRFTSWLAALEHARDDEARAAGVEGADLAAAVLASLRFQLGTAGSGATLIGETPALPARIARLLQPLPETPPHRETRGIVVIGSLFVALLLAVEVGVAWGERLIAPLIALSGGG
jgi:Zn-dependent protease with chaperone function